MHMLVLCLWVLGIVSAADNQTQGPLFISQTGLTPGYASGQTFPGTSVSSNNVKVFPNSYTPEASTGDSNGSPISVPGKVKSDSPLQSNTNIPIPVPVSYSDEDSAATEQFQLEKPKSIQKASVRKVTPVPVLVKATASSYRAVASTPRPFMARDPQLTNHIATENAFSVVSPSFRLWPKLPEPVPVPVFTADKFVKSSYQNTNTNLVPQYIQKVPQPVNNSPSFSNGNQQFQTQQSQPNPVQSNQGPIYVIIPGGNNNNPQTASFQAPNPNSNSYQSQATQPGNQAYIILAPVGTNSQSNYQNNGFNPYFGSQPGQQQPLNNGGFSPFNAGSQPQATNTQQAPLNYEVFAPQNAALPVNQPQTQYPDQQSALKYAIFGPQGTPGSLANSVGQAPQNYPVFAPGNAPGSQPNNPSQSPFPYAIFGSPNGETAFPSPTPAPQQFASYSPTPAPQNLGYPSSTQSPQYFGSPQAPQSLGYPSPSQSPQYFGYSPSPQAPQNLGYPSPTQSPQYFGFSPSPQAQQNLGYPSSTQMPQYLGYSPSTQLPQYAGYSSTPSPSQLGYSQSSTVSHVNYSGAGNNYSYSVK